MLDKLNISSENVSNYWQWDPVFESMVHPHWRQFPPVPEFHHWLVGAYITIVGITGDVGNMLVIYIFLSTKALRTPPNMFLVNLACSDLCFNLFMGFPLLTISSMNGRWAWGKLTCEIYGFVGGLFGFLSIGTLTLIAIDRYLVIVQPIQALRTMTHRRAAVLILIAWMWALAWSIPPWFGFGRYIPEGFQTSCTFDYLTQTKENIIFNIGMYVFGFCLPLLTIILCYYKIVLAVRHHEQEMTKMATKLGGRSMKTKDQKNDLKTAKVALIIVVLYLLSWTPYATVALVALTGRTDHLTPYTSEIPVLAAKTSAIYNPIIYSLSHPKFRAVLEQKFPWLMCCCPNKPKKSATSEDGRITRQNTERIANEGKKGIEMGTIKENEHEHENSGFTSEEVSVSM